MTRTDLWPNDQDGIPEPYQRPAELPSLVRLADLIAAGQADCPGGLPDEDLERLVRLVRQRLRQRLLRYLARQIALDLHRQAGPQE
jgi:hypothetical protein